MSVLTLEKNELADLNSMLAELDLQINHNELMDDTIALGCMLTCSNTCDGTCEGGCTGDCEGGCSGNLTVG